MARFTLEIPDTLNDWLTRQALKSERSKHKHIRYLLERARIEESRVPRFILNHSGLCHNGTHCYKSNEPSTKDFCNCQMYTYGELK